MSQRIRVQPYGASNSARDISNSLNDLGIFPNIMRLKKAERSGFRIRPNDIIVNWGSSKSRFPEDQYLNKPSAVANAANKLRTFQALQGHVTIPAYTTSRQVAHQDILDGITMYCRTTLSGNSGNGIVVANTVDELVCAPLYTCKVDCDQEYRMHVYKNADGEYELFDVQQKKKRNGANASDLIRNHDNGWVFCRDGVVPPVDACTQALKAAEVLGLDFCGVDVGYNTNSSVATVYEVNTACGLVGTTLVKYTTMLQTLLSTHLECA